MVPCKHLDYEGEYTDYVVRSAAPHFPTVKYWVRGAIWTDGGNPGKVQFCKLRGRINGVFACYGEMFCYEPAKDEDDE